MWAANKNKLDCLEHLTAKGANLEATNEVSAALPAGPNPLNTLAHRPRPRRPPSLLPRTVTPLPHTLRAAHRAEAWRTAGKFTSDRRLARATYTYTCTVR